MDALPKSQPPHAPLHLDDAMWRALMIEILSPLATKPLTETQLENASPIVSYIVGRRFGVGESDCADVTCGDDDCGCSVRCRSSFAKR